MTPEGRIKAKVKGLLEDFDVYYFTPATGGYGRSGVPDFVGCANGRFFSVECKANGNKPTALQDREMRRIQESGGKPFVVYDADSYALLFLWLKDIDDRSCDRKRNGEDK